MESRKPGTREGAKRRARRLFFCAVVMLGVYTLALTLVMVASALCIPEEAQIMEIQFGSSYIIVFEFRGGIFTCPIDADSVNLLSQGMGLWVYGLSPCEFEIK